VFRKVIQTNCCVLLKFLLNQNKLICAHSVITVITRWQPVTFYRDCSRSRINAFLCQRCHILFADSAVSVNVLKEAWLWRCSEGRVGSYALKADFLLLASYEIDYSTFNVLFRGGFKFPYKTENWPCHFCPTKCNIFLLFQDHGDLLNTTSSCWLQRLVLTHLTLFKVLLWLVLLGLSSELEFGLPFFVISLFYWLYEGLRSPKARQPGEMSAYSVFNPDCQPILGTLTAEQLEGEMGFMVINSWWPIHEHV